MDDTKAYICSKLTKLNIMLRKLTFIILCFSIFGSAFAQRGGADPRTYYREFQSQSRRVMIKVMRYMEGTVRNEDPRRIIRYQEMVQEQLVESKRAIARIGAFNGDSLLRREFLRGLEMYQAAFSEEFSDASLIENKYNSYEDLAKYYEAQNKSDLKLFDAAFIIEKAEDHFGKSYDVDLRRKPEDKELFDKLDLLSIYTQELTLAYFKTDAQLLHLIEAAEAGKADTLLNITKDLRYAISESKRDMQDLPEFDGKDWFEKEVEFYLNEITQALDQEIVPTAELLSNKFLPGDEYDDAMKDLEDIKEWQVDAREDFFKTLNEVVERYLPED